MSDIVLATLNARYAHCAFGLRYLLANLGELQSRTRLLEFDISQRTLDVAEVILREEPKVVGLGVYVWNATQSTQLVAELKRLRPELVVVLGGPEVSYETEHQEICRLADFVVKGEGEAAFAELCREVVGQAGSFFAEKVRTSKMLVLRDLVLPYDLYSDEDIAHRVIYVEASRGCPFECEFCLSALDEQVRQFPLDRFLEAMQRLLDRSARQFKFVDRTFNLNLTAARAILEFFLERMQPGLFLHFEMIPDRLPAGLRELIVKFPAGSLQFEVGIQTFNEEVAARISRRQDNTLAEANLRWLREETGVHIHSDLIVGLPGESLESFAAGFDRLVGLRPHEIQVGILKRLRGAPIARHDGKWTMVYDPTTPYEILQNRQLDFFTMQRMRRFARYWDLVANSGNFVETTPLIWRGTTPFAGFVRFSDWLFERTRQTHGIARSRLVELLAEYLGNPETLQRDQQRKASGATARQARHR
jgi:radical SAM superfamily enzyme YgiQ (UPF0313 family)